MVPRKDSSIDYVYGFDGVRAIACVLVVLFHFTSPFAAEMDRQGGWWSAWARFLNVGWIGVDIFFVVSGFFIARITSKNPVNSFARYAAFLYGRGRRLFPAYCACLIAFAAAAATTHPDSKVLNNQYLLWSLSSNIESSFGDRGALTDLHFSLVHFWSLALEWQFYVLFPLTLVVFRSPTTSAIALIATALVCRCFFFALGLSDNATYSFTFCRVDSFAFGVLLAAWYRIPSEKFCRNCAALGAFGFSAIIFFLAGSDFRFKSLNWLQTIGYTAISASVAMMLLGILRSDILSRGIKLLEHPWLTLIGRSSYSLYIWHLVFFPTIITLLGAAASGLFARYFWTLMFSLFVTAVLGGTSYLCIEKRFTRKRPA